MQSSRRLPAAVAALLLATAAPALAQAQQAPDPAPDAAQDSYAGDVIVTATRREERLRDVPASVTALNADQLAKSGIDSARDLALVTPGLNFAQASIVAQPTIRGVGLRGTNAGDESVVPIYIDGVYQPFILANFFELNNLERVEVLKGPQGTLFGRNATGGAINFITRKPGDTASFNGSLSYGSYDEVMLKGYAATPVAAGIGIDMAANYLRDDGYVRDITSGRRVAERELFQFRTGLSADLSDSFNLRVAYSHLGNSDNTANSVAPINGNTVARRTVPTVVAPNDPYQVSLSFQSVFTVKQDAISLIGALQLGDVEVRSLTGLQQGRGHVVSDQDATAANIGLFDYYQGSRSFSQEVVASSSWQGLFNFTAGTMYFYDRSYFDPLRTAVNSLTSEAGADSIAIYGQGNLDLGSGFKVTVGGRFTSEKKTIDAIRRTFATNRVETVAAGKRFEKFTPSVSLAYAISDDVNIYARYSEAFKSGIFNSNTIQATPVNPEVVEGYEAGLKARLGPRAALNIAGYYSNYSNIQASARDPISGTVFLQNAATARIWGIEGDLALRPVRNLNLSIGLSYVDAKYRSFPAAQVTVPQMGGGNTSPVVDASGRFLPKTPDLTATAAADYSFNFGSGRLNLSANYFHSGRIYWDTLNRLRQKPYDLVNAQISWRPSNESYELAAWGKNVFDQTYELQIQNSASGDVRAWARPATFGARLSVFLK